MPRTVPEDHHHVLNTNIYTYAYTLIYFGVGIGDSYNH
jgi:hypothetical protein